MICSKCLRDVLPEKLMVIEDEHHAYNFCKSCILKAYETLGMKLFRNKEERKLLKNMRRFLKVEKN